MSNNNNNKENRDMLITVSFIVKENDIFNYCKKHKLAYDNNDAVESVLGCEKWYEFLVSHENSDPNLEKCEILDN